MVDKFVLDTDLKRLEKLNDYYKIFKAELYNNSHKETVFALKNYFQLDPKKKDILSVAVNIGSLITTTFADFFVGEGFTVRHKNPQTEAKLKEIKIREELDVKLYQSALCFSFSGYAVFEVFAREKKAKVMEIPYDNYFPKWAGVDIGGSPEEIVVANFFRKTDGKSEKDYVLKRINNAGKIENQVWSLDAQNKQIAQQPLTDFYPEKKELEETGLKVIPIFQVDNIRTIKERYGASDYQKVLSLLEEVNDRFTQISLQFVKHLTSKISVPRNSMPLDEKGNVISEDLEVLLTEAGDVAPTYLEYKNPLIESAFSHIDKTIDKICAITQVPRELFGSEKGGVEKVEAMQIRLLPFIKKIRRAQRAYMGLLAKVFTTALRIETGQELDISGLEIVFEDGLPVDRYMEARALETALNAGLMSKRRAVSEFNSIDGDELEEELALIDEQERMTIALPTN